MTARPYLLFMMSLAFSGTLMAQGRAAHLPMPSLVAPPAPTDTVYLESIRALSAHERSVEVHLGTLSNLFVVDCLNRRYRTVLTDGEPSTWPEWRPLADMWDRYLSRVVCAEKLETRGDTTGGW